MVFTTKRVALYTLWYGGRDPKDLGINRGIVISGRLEFSKILYVKKTKTNNTQSRYKLADTMGQRIVSVSQ